MSELRKELRNELGIEFGHYGMWYCIEKFTVYSFGVYNIVKEPCSICMEHSLYFDGISNYKDELDNVEKYEEPMYDLECKHYFCVNCVRDMSNFFFITPRLKWYSDYEGNYFERDYKNEYPCPICRRNIVGMLHYYQEHNYKGSDQSEIDTFKSTLKEWLTSFK